MLAGWRGKIQGPKCLRERRVGTVARTVSLILQADRPWQNPPTHMKCVHYRVMAGIFVWRPPAAWLYCGTALSLWGRRAGAKQRGHENPGTNQL